MPLGESSIPKCSEPGSARELVGAYLGTACVFNEISAHAAGALHFAPDIDTIFEIGGQDSKYVFLRLQNWLACQAERKAEQHYRGLFQNTGLLVAGPNEPAAIFEEAAQHISPRVYGEVIPTVGQSLRARSGGYDGIILVGPFNCLPFRISEAILKPLSLQSGIPVLTYESDGYAVSPSILRQVSVHIQQVLDHASGDSASARVSRSGPV